MNTHGSVTIEDGNPGEPGDFNPRRKVSVTFSFDAENEEDGKKFLDDAADIANRKVNELLGRTAKTKTPKAPTAAEAAAKEILDPVTGEMKKTSVAKVAKAKSDKDKLAEAAGLPTADTVAKGNPPSLIEEGEELGETGEADDMNDLLGDAAPAPITDAELAKAAQTKNGLMKQKDPNWQPIKLRELIVAYAGPAPKKITDIPVAKRQEFLDKLKALE